MIRCGGLARQKARRIKEILNAIWYDLHLALITHGRTVCLVRRPRCEVCVLLYPCP